MGPDFWKVKYEKCKGQNQSPINIRTRCVVHNNLLKDIQFNGYNADINWNMTNKGLTGFKKIHKLK
jgi:hypothetical protein